MPTVEIETPPPPLLSTSIPRPLAASKLSVALVWVRETPPAPPLCLRSKKSPEATLP